MPRLSKIDWIELGFKILSEFAQDKLRIQYLCTEMGVTRGSFYHHFESMEQYIAELMLNYEQMNTLRLIEAASQATTLEEKVALLDQMISKSNHRLEASIRSFAFYNPLVKQHLDRVDTTRLKYLEELHLEGGADSESALRKSKLDYATLIGVQMMEPDISPEDMVELYKDYPLKP